MDNIIKALSVSRFGILCGQSKIALAQNIAEIHINIRTDSGIEKFKEDYCKVFGE